MKKCELLVRGGSLPLAGCHSAIGDSGTVSGGTSSDVSGGQERILANWCVTWAHRTARATLGRRSGERRSHRARQREGRAALQLRPQAPQRAPQSLYALSVRGAFSCAARCAYPFSYGSYAGACLTARALGVLRSKSKERGWSHAHRSRALAPTLGGLFFLHAYDDSVRYHYQTWPVLFCTWPTPTPAGSKDGDHIFCSEDGEGDVDKPE